MILCTTYLIRIRDWHCATFKTFPKSRYWPGDDVFSSLTTSILVKVKTSRVVVPPFYSLTSPPNREDMTMSSKNIHPSPKKPTKMPPAQIQQLQGGRASPPLQCRPPPWWSAPLSQWPRLPYCSFCTGNYVRWEYCVCMWILLLFVQ